MALHRAALVTLVVTVSGCELYFDDSGHPSDPGPEPSPPSYPDAGSGTGAGCDIVGCSAGNHCQIDCKAIGADGCIHACQPTCVADQSCDTIECGPDQTCVEECPNEGCGGMPQWCRQTCASGDALTTCSAITNEMECAARADCNVYWLGHDCTCVGLQCDCTPGEFTRCGPKPP